MMCHFEPYEGSKPYIFVSYSHADADRVGPILDRMQAAGFRIWYDDGIDWGTEWPAEIEKHLRNCAVCMAFHSATSVESANCRQEITFAIQNKKSILPVYLEDVKLKMGLEMQMTLYQALHFWRYPDREKFFKQLLSAPAIRSCTDAEMEISAEETREAAAGESPRFAPAPNVYFDDAVTGTGKARRILQPLEGIHQIINNGRFDFVQDLMQSPEDVTWDQIKGGAFDLTRIEDRCRKIVEERTDIEGLRGEILGLYEAYERKVLDFIREEGVEAFVNLYRGNFAEVNGSRGMGIGEMLRNLTEGKNADGSERHDLTEEAARKRHLEAHLEIQKTRRHLIDLHGIMRTQQYRWLATRSDVYRTMINENRRSMALGPYGVLSRCVLEPAANMVRQIEEDGSGVL